ncbi:MAG: hypothetical protein HY313_00365 [Acidobacteria bacterium]|nr:hypothetical protein [Acidobacteriota bacterium]
MIDQDLAYSRPRATAARLAAYAAEAHRFTEKTVLLTGDAETLATSNGTLCLLDALRLLLRTVKHLHVHVPPQCSALLASVEALACKLEFGTPIVFLEDIPQWQRCDAILSVGWRVRPELPWTAVNSNGWVARVSSGSALLPPECDQHNPVGALGAASFGVSEVFKRLVGLRPERGSMFDRMQFSFYDYSVDPSNLGPILLPELHLPPTLLAGGGAIGNGIALLVSQFNLIGKIWVLDRQAFGPENLGTCVMLGPNGVESLKAEYLSAELCDPGRLHAIPLTGEIAAVKHAFGRTVPFPVLVLAGFDNVSARHRLQELWPDWLIDGGISDFGVQVSAHYWGRSVGCLKCQFVEEVHTDHTTLAAELTGLRPERLASPEDVIRSEDVEAAPSERREQLQRNVGKKICSVVSEAAIKSISSAGARNRFSPSVPFVACASAALVFSKALRLLLEGRDDAPPRFVFDILTGPAGGVELFEKAKATCDCVRRASIIERWRQERLLAPADNLTLSDQLL